MSTEMSIEKLLDALEEKIDGCTTIPIWGRGIIDKEEILDALADIRTKFPEEFRQAKYVKEERVRIINDAKKEAAALVKAAEDKIEAMVNEHDITQAAYAKGNQILDDANQHSHEIHVRANQYVDDILKALEEELIKTADTVRSNRIGSK